MCTNHVTLGSGEPIARQCKWIGMPICAITRLGPSDEILAGSLSGKQNFEANQAKAIIKNKQLFKLTINF